jgi:hypothetical protein
MALELALESLSDDEVLRGLAEALGRSRDAEPSLVAHIGEVDVRRLYARFACSSMHAYCTHVLHLSDAEAYLRIEVARAARKHPMLLGMLADGRLHLSGIERLAPHLTRENRDAVLARAVYKTRREIEELVAELAPRPDAPSVIRKLPQRARLSDSADRVEEAPELRLDGVQSSVRPGLVPLPAPARAPAFQPLSPARYKVEFTAGAELRDKLERLRALMRSEVPDGDLAAVIDKAVTRELERREARRFAETRFPRTESPGRILAPAMSRPPSVGPSFGAREVVAASSMRSASGARSVGGSSTTTGMRLGEGAAVVRTTSS